MKKILLACIISVSFLSSAHATTLLPSLTDQIVKQEKINKKSDYITRAALKKQELEAKRQANLARIANLRNKELQRTSGIIPIKTSPITPVLTPSITLSPTITSPTKTQTPIIQSQIAPSPQNVDMNRVRTTWMSWYNSVRQSEGLSPYTYDSRLESTAYDWNIEFAKGKGLNHHTRNPGDGYYNFTVIDQWFMDRGINPKVINRAKHTENVGYGSYSCASGDCTDALIASIRSTFDFFMSEKGKSYDLHYRSIVQPYFSKIGLSVITVPSENRYYITIHYITE